MSRRYQVLPDRGVCFYRGCPWHMDGPAAESLGELHSDDNPGHRVEVTASSKVIFIREPATAVTR